MPAAYRGLAQSLRRYWADYGGWRAFFASPLVHLSVFISAFSYDAWASPKWVDLPLALLPNLLGFSLGAYALIFSLANERLLAALNAATDELGRTLLRIINATFLHFILVQSLAIIFALAQKSSAILDAARWLLSSPAAEASATWWLTRSAGAFGHWLTIYAVVLLIGAALGAYRLAIMSGRAASAALPQLPPIEPGNELRGTGEVPASDTKV